MANLTLPREVLSLVHHVELNRAGWWKKAIQRLILSTVWLSKENPTLQTILEHLRRDFQVNLDIGRVRDQINALCTSGVLVSLPDGRLKISERALKEFEKDLQEAEQIERNVKNTFVELVKDRCPSLQPEKIWTTFHDELLLPLIRELGARTYELISGIRVDLDVSATFPGFLRQFPSESREPLRNTIVTFLDPKNPDVRRYILRCLNAYFFVETIGLTEETLNSIADLVNLRPSFTVFVDTNFLFSILGLHENPSNEAALSLRELITQLSGRVTVNLYALPVTIDEARRVLATAEQSLTGLRLTQNLADAALEAGLTGMTRKFVEESKKAEFRLNPADYFQPYRKDLIQILRSKGVEFFNEKVDHYNTKQEVLDDIVEQQEFEEKRYANRAKTYEVLKHDIVLWHFVRDKRPKLVESPLDAKYFIVTIDYRFLRFDALKRSKMKDSIPICLHPSTFVQILQFWVPRTPEFEAVMLSSIKLPFLFQEFDPVAERMTIRILQALGRFQNIGDIPKDTVTAVLLSEVLRQRLSAEQDVEKQVERVREALIEEHQKTRQKLEETITEAEGLKKEVLQKEEIIQKLEQEIRDQKEKLLLTEDRLKEESEARQALEARIHELKERLRAEKEAVQKQRRIRGFVIKWLSLLVLLILALVVFTNLLLEKFIPWGFWRTAVLVWSLGLIVWIWLAERYGSKDSIISEWQPFKLFQKVKNWLFGGLGLSVLGNAVWDLLKGIWR